MINYYVFPRSVLLVEGSEKHRGVLAGLKVIGRLKTKLEFNMFSSGQ